MWDGKGIVVDFLKNVDIKYWCDIIDKNKEE